MSCILISVENLNKCYPVNDTKGGARYPTLRDVVACHALASFKAIGGKIRASTGPNGSIPRVSNGSALDSSVEKLCAAKEIYR
jgi:hypothetical protein